MYVYDYQYKQIRSYNAAGKFLRNIGRSGSGPGEYRNAVMTVTNDSVLVVLDAGNTRVSYFNPDGTVRSTFTNSSIGNFASDAFGVDKQGLVSWRLTTTRRGGKNRREVYVVCFPPATPFSVQWHVGRFIAVAKAVKLRARETVYY